MFKIKEFEENKEFFMGFLVEYLRDQYDLYVFEVLTAEEHLQLMIKVCKKHGIDRWQLIDDIKDELIQILSQDRFLRNLNIEKLVNRDPELIPIGELVKYVKLVDKKIVLFNIFTKYPELVEALKSICYVETFHNGVSLVLKDIDPEEITKVR